VCVCHADDGKKDGSGRRIGHTWAIEGAGFCGKRTIIMNMDWEARASRAG